jgi:hypothetical protein
MDAFIARENIKHFQDLLQTSSDDAQRRTLEALLAAEQKKLEGLAQLERLKLPRADGDASKAGETGG